MRSILLTRLRKRWLFTLDCAGRFVHWATSEGRPTFIGLATLVGGTLASQLIPVPNLFWLVPTAIALLLLLAWAWRARRSIVIDDFVDHTEDAAAAENAGAVKKSASESTNAAPGAATLLATELARIRDIFRVVDERNALPTAVDQSEPLEAAVKVDELNAVIHESITPETRLKIGPIEIPVGAGMYFFGRLVQGPRLRCHIHLSGNRLVLTAQLAGLRQKPAWRLERVVQNSSRAERLRALHEMIPELAVRVFTSVGMKRKVKWQAMKEFSDALRLYRLCLRTPRDRAVKLLAARRHLVQAVAADEDFVLVYYNLGVIYNELSRIAERAERHEVAERHRNAAEAAFVKAVERAPTRWEAYYALARLAFRADDKASARELCRRITEFGRKRDAGLIERAKAHDLIGRTFEPDDVETLAHRRRASKLALRALRNALLGRHAHGAEDDPIPTLRDLAANCLASLASAEARYGLPPMPAESAGRFRWWLWRQRARFDRIEALIKLAEYLTSKDANLHFQLGKIATEWHAYDVAVRELGRAVRIEPDRPLFLAHLADAYARRGKDGDAGQAKAKSLRAAAVADLMSRDRLDQETLDLVRDTLERVGAEDGSHELTEMRAFGEESHKLAPSLSDPNAAAQIRRRAGDNRRDEMPWQAGHLYLMLGKHELGSGTPQSAARAEGDFRDAIDCFKEATNRPREIARHDVRALLARALAIQGKHDAALRQAENALSISPMSSYAHASLGHVYNAAGDLEGARDAWNDALLWKPDDPQLYWELGFCTWKLGQELGVRPERRGVLEDAEQLLEQAAELFPNERFDDRVRIHYWLARLHEELGRSHRVVSSLRLVQRSPRMSVVADYLVAQANRRLGNYNEAERLLRSVIDNTAVFDAEEDVVGADIVLEAWPLSVLHAEARCALAGSHAARGGDIDEARWQLGRVESALHDGDTLSPRLDAFPEKRRELLSAYHHAWGRVHLHEGNPSAARRELETSIGHKADAEVYLDLARCYWMQMLDTATDEHPLLLDRIHRYCDLARTTDLRMACKDGVKELIERLDERRHAENGAAAVPVP